MVYRLRMGPVWVQNGCSLVAKKSVDVLKIAYYNIVKAIKYRQNERRIDMIISERIFKIMDERGMTQIEFSRKTGISQSTISDWKRKKTNPAADKIMVICDVLNVSPYDVLQDTVKQNNKSDYRIVSEGTTDYELMVEIDTLNTKQKERLKGYLSAIKENI